MISTTCPACQRVLQIDEQYAGQTGRCLHCGGRVVLPFSSDSTGVFHAPIRVPSKPKEDEMIATRVVKPPIEPMDKPEPNGIAGWLLIPAIGLVLGPIIGAAKLILGIGMIETFAPELKDDPRLW